MSNVEAISRIVCTWGGKQLVFNDLTSAFNLSSICDRLEHACGRWLVLVHWHRVIVAHARICLLKVNVDRYRLHKVEGVFLIERQAEFTFWSKLWAEDVSFNWFRIVLTWAKFNCRIRCLLISRNLETRTFGGETIEESLLAAALVSKVMLHIVDLLVGTRPCFTIEILFQF